MDGSITKIECLRSHIGLPTLREEGGAWSSKGRARIITDAKGYKIKPIFIPKGKVRNGYHAVFVLHKGYYILDVIRKEEHFEITVYRVVNIPKTDNKIEVLIEYSYAGSNPFEGDASRDQFSGHTGIHRKLFIPMKCLVNKALDYNSIEAVYYKDK